MNLPINNEIKEKIKSLVKDIEKYKETHREELTQKIATHIKEIGSSERYLKTTIEKTELGQKLFRSLRSYIDIRYSSLLELVKSDLSSLAPPSASGKLSFEAGILGNFPLTQPALSKGITACAIEDSLKALKIRVKTETNIKKETLNKEMGEKPPPIKQLQQKKETLKRYKKSLKEEISLAGQGVPLEELLSRSRKLLSEKEVSYKVTALVNLLLNRQIKIQKENGKISIVEQEDE